MTVVKWLFLLCVYSLGIETVGPLQEPSRLLQSTTKRASQLSDIKAGIELKGQLFYQVPGLIQVNSGMVHPFGKLTLAAGVNLLSLDSIYQETEISLSGCLRMKKMAIGLVGTVVMQDIQKAVYANSLTLTPSMQWSLNESACLGLVLPEITVIKVYEQSSLVRPFALFARFESKPINLLLDLEWYRNEWGNSGVKIYEWWTGIKGLAIGGAIQSEPLFFSLGVSLFFREWSTAVLHHWQPDLGTSRSFSICRSTR